jgi:hypothetical protein
MKWLVLLLAAAALMEAADVEAIRQTQAKLIAMRGQNEDVRGANPNLTLLKHQLRDWAESRISKLKRDADLGEASSQLNGELGRFKLTREDQNYEEYRLGEIDVVSLHHPEGDQSWLLVTTVVGIDSCGHDTSIYLYEWRGGAWSRLFELEQVESGDHFAPIESLASVEVSQPDEYLDRRVLVLSNSWGCASMWQGFSYSLFKIGGERTTLLDDTATVYMGGEENSYHGRLEPGGILLEHLGDSIDSGILIRQHVLHYAIDGNSVRRIEPIALTAQDFVDEWLRGEWADVGQFSDSRLRSIHTDLHEPPSYGEFQFVQHCPGNSDKWQIAINLEDMEDDTYYFLVQQNGEHSFRMIDVSDERQPGCPGEDSPHNLGTQSTYPTLFPTKKP